MLSGNLWTIGPNLDVRYGSECSAMVGIRDIPGLSPHPHYTFRRCKSMRDAAPQCSTGLHYMLEQLSLTSHMYSMACCISMGCAIICTMYGTFDLGVDGLAAIKEETTAETLGILTVIMLSYSSSKI